MCRIPDAGGGRPACFGVQRTNSHYTHAPCSVNTIIGIHTTSVQGYIVFCSREAKVPMLRLGCRNAADGHPTRVYSHPHRRLDARMYLEKTPDRAQLPWRHPPRRHRRLPNNTYPLDAPSHRTQQTPQIAGLLLAVAVPAGYLRVRQLFSKTHLSVLTGSYYCHQQGPDNVSTAIAYRSTAAQ